MVNLLPGTRSRPSLPALTREQRARVRTRWSRIAGWPTELRLELARRAHARLEAELEELEQAPALEHALDLLAGLDAIRSELVAADPDPETAGGPSDPSEADPATWVVYWPGRSLASGEAEIASRGYLDVWDRPPLGDWLEAVARPTRTPPGPGRSTPGPVPSQSATREPAPEPSEPRIGEPFGRPAYLPALMRGSTR